MGYNKAKEEKKWLLWKEVEEKELRQLGVSEDKIKQLRDMDWKAFKAERRFYEHCLAATTYIDQQSDDDASADISTVQALLDDIENAELHRLLLSADKLTLQIVLLKMEGCEVREIAKQLHLTDKAVYRRMDRIKEKIKNIL